MTSVLDDAYSAVGRCMREMEASPVNDVCTINRQDLEAISLALEYAMQVDESTGRFLMEEVIPRMHLIVTFCADMTDRNREDKRLYIRDQAQRIHGLSVQRATALD